jgi:hypothetical protein
MRAHTLVDVHRRETPNLERDYRTKRTPGLPCAIGMNEQIKALARLSRCV